jgi:uncharacterized membrane protein
MRKGIFWGQSSSLERLLTLTDGVYAIVLTLLVLDLKVPDASEATNVELMQDLLQQIPNFTAYLISFFVIILFWMRHHWILKPLTTCSETVFWFNLLHVFFLSLIPYTSSLVGHYEQDSIAVVIFSGSIGLTGLSLLLIHRHVTHKPEWCGEPTVAEWTSPNWWIDYPAPFIALGSICLAFVNIPAALGVWLLALLWGGLLLAFRR